MSESLNLTSVFSVKLICSKLSDSEPQVVINILYALENLSQNKQFQHSLEIVDIWSFLFNIAK
jgi:hypothetical protein